MVEVGDDLWNLGFCSRDGYHVLTEDCTRL